MVQKIFYLQIICAIIMVINVCFTSAEDFSSLWIVGKIAGTIFTAGFLIEVVVEIIKIIKR